MPGTTTLPSIQSPWLLTPDSLLLALLSKAGVLSKKIPLKGPVQLGFINCNLDNLKLINPPI